MRVAGASLVTYNQSIAGFKNNESNQQSFGTCNGTSCSTNPGLSRGIKIIASVISLTIAGITLATVIGFIWKLATANINGSAS